MAAGADPLAGAAPRRRRSITSGRLSEHAAHMHGEPADRQGAPAMVPRRGPAWRCRDRQRVVDASRTVPSVKFVPETAPFGAANLNSAISWRRAKATGPYVVRGQGDDGTRLYQYFSLRPSLRQLHVAQGSPSGPVVCGAVTCRCVWNPGPGVHAESSPRPSEEGVSLLTPSNHCTCQRFTVKATLHGPVDCTYEYGTGRGMCGLVAFHFRW